MTTASVIQKTEPASARLKIFLSCTGDDRAWAKQLYDVLTDRGHEAFFYKEDVGYGDGFQEIIREKIENCDCVLVLLSQSLVDTQRSSWPAREIHLATDLQARRGARKINRHPAVIGMVNKEQSGNARDAGGLSLAVFDFATGAALEGRRFDFSSQNLIGFWPSHEPGEFLEGLDRSFQQEVAHIRSKASMETHRDLFERAMDLYEQLIPDDCERDPREFIQEWISDTGGTRGNWLDWLSVMHFHGNVTGAFWCNIDLRTGLAHVPFWGMRAGKTNRAKLLSVELVASALSAMQEELKTRGVALLGAVFEAEPVDTAYFDALALRAARRASPGTEPAKVTKALLETLHDRRPGERFSPLELELINTAKEEPRDDSGNFMLQDQIRRFRRLALYAGKAGYSRFLRGCGFEVQAFVISPHGDSERDSVFATYTQPPIIPPEDPAATIVSDGDKRPFCLFMMTPMGVSVDAARVVDWEYDVFLGEQYREGGGDSALPRWEEYMVDFKRRFRDEFANSARLMIPSLGMRYHAAKTVLLTVLQWSRLDAAQHPVPGGLDITL